jgi:hypothetical protein
MKRIFFFLLLLSITIFIHPIVGIVASLVVGISVHYRFFEIIFLGLIIDIMYGSVYVFGPIQIPLYSFITFIIFFSLSFIKKRLNFHA